MVGKGRWDRRGRKACRRGGQLSPSAAPGPDPSGPSRGRLMAPGVLRTRALDALPCGAPPKRWAPKRTKAVPLQPRPWQVEGWRGQPCSAPRREIV